MRDAFHQAAIADKRVGVMIDHRQIRLVEFGRKQFLCQRHTDRIGNALTEWPGSSLDAWCDMDFRMASSLGVQLAEILDLVHRQVVTGQMQQGILQHRAMTVREHKAVTIGPQRVSRIVPIVLGPQRHRDLCHSHRHAGVARVSFLYCIHCQSANRIGHLVGWECGSHVDVKELRSADKKPIQHAELMQHRPNQH